MRSTEKILIIILLFFYEPAYPSDTTSVFSAGFRGHYGFIIPHSAAIEPVSHTNPYGFEISLSRFHRSYNKWQVFNSYWMSGIQAGFFDFQNPAVLGRTYNVTIFAEPLLFHDTKNRMLLSVRGIMGLSLHTRFYDRIENPLNQFFSTGINFPLFLDLKFRYRIGNQNYLTLSGCYNHISNGGLKQPNKGMNFPTLAIGFERFRLPLGELNHGYTNSLQNTRPELSMMFQILAALKIIEAAGEMPEKAVFAYGFHTRISRQMKSWYAPNVGAEMIFDGYIKETIKREQKDTDYRRFALTAGQDLLFGKVIFTQYLGVYLYAPYKARNAVYQKYELAYRLFPNMSAGVYLKAHLHVAELMGLNCSYILPGKSLRNR